MTAMTFVPCAHMEPTVFNQYLSVARNLVANGNIWPLLLAACIGLVITGCEPPQTKGPVSYYAVAPLVKAETERLKSAKTGIHKQATLDGKPEEHNLNEGNWNHELDPFLAMDINKPSWKGLFKADTARDAAGMFITYTASKPDFLVQKLTVSVSTSGKPIRISANLLQDNVLSTVEKTLQLDFDTAGKLVKYFSQGRQKVIFMDETRFAITGTVQQ